MCLLEPHRRQLTEGFVLFPSWPFILILSELFICSFDFVNKYGGKVANPIDVFPCVPSHGSIWYSIFVINIQLP